jgi:hypothetical protein
MAAKAKKRGAKKSASPGGQKANGRPQQARAGGGRRSKRRPGTLLALLVLTAVQALGAIGGGIGLVADPTNNIGMPVSQLEGTPFNDYLIPGLILLIVVGLFSLLVFVGLLLRWKAAWWLSLASGGGLVIWIITEIALLGFLPSSGTGLQITFGVVGVLILVLALSRPTRRYFEIGRQQG